MTVRRMSWPGWRTFSVGIVCGGVVWGLSVPVTGMREPFDSPGMYYPAAMFFAGAVAALEAFWLDRAEHAPTAASLEEHVREEDAFLTQLGGRDAGKT